MRISLVLDASAVAKWFVKEEEYHEMRKIRDLYLEGKISLYIPSLLFIELANTLRYIKGLTSLDVINAVRALKMLHLNVADSIKVLDRAIEVAFSYNITIYDAIYVVLAENINATLITYDAELLSKFSGLAKKAGQIIGELGVPS